jgi:hypothetical protein
VITKTGKTKALFKRTRRPRRPRLLVVYTDTRGNIHEWELADGAAQTIVKAVRKLQKKEGA